LLPLTVGGAAMSAAGRVGLAYLSRHAGRWLPETDRRNAEALGGAIRRHRNWRTAIVFGYCLAPIPSNPLFIAAGVGRAPLVSVPLAFLAAGAVAGPFWVLAAGRGSRSQSAAVPGQGTRLQAAAVQVTAPGPGGPRAALAGAGLPPHRGPRAARGEAA